MPEHKRFLGGETIAQLLDRVTPQIGRLRADSDWDTVLLVLHGGVNRAILSHALTGQRLFLGNLAQTAGCINALTPNAAQQVLDWAIQAHGAAGVSDDFPLAYMWAGNHTMRLADGQNEVHRNAIAKLELAKHMPPAGKESKAPA